MRKILTYLTILFLNINFSYSQGFEGKIYFQKKSVFDTVYFTYSVKKDFIRVDEYNKQNQLEKSVIFDIEKNQIVALNPTRQLYTRIEPKDKNVGNDNCMIIKSNNSCMINGYQCYQWRVKNVASNTETTYWVAKYNFDNFDRLLQIWHNLDSSMDLYLELPDSKGYLPMLAVERTLLRDERLRTSVIQIEQTQISDEVFEVPMNYKFFQMSY